MDVYTDIDSDLPYNNPFPNWPFDLHPLNDPPPRITLAGSLDPTTGIFYRTPEHPRLRTAQACEKCRTRKAKVCLFHMVSSSSCLTTVGQCSGDHPSCARCLARGLACEYAKEGRVRGPNKPKSRAGSAASTHSSHSSQHSPAPLPYPTPVGVNLNAKRRRHTTHATTGGGVKLEPLSSCVPLDLPSSKSNAQHWSGGHANGQPLHPTPLNAHLLPMGATKRFSLPASLSALNVSPHTFSHPMPSSASAHTSNGLATLATISSAYQPYPSSVYTDSYTDSGYPDSLYPDSAYTDESPNRRSFVQPFPLARPHAHKYGEDLDSLDHRTTFPLVAGYTLEPDCATTGFPARGVGGLSLNMGFSSSLAMRRESTRSLSTRSLSDGSGGSRGSMSSGSASVDGGDSA